MALILYPTPTPSSSSCSSFTTTNKYKPHLLLRTPPHRLKPTSFTVRSQQDSSTKEVTSGSGSGPSPKKPGDSSSSGSGFGSMASAKKQQQQKGKRERASIIRRDPVEKPSFVTPQTAAQSEEQRKNESAFLLSWLGLGAIILFQGIALAASGFLPESWDGFFVKYLYPSFTPTVFLFVAGTVTYGVLKYLQNEELNKEN